MADSPYLGAKSNKTKEKSTTITPETNDKCDYKDTIKYVSIVVTILVIIMLIYYAVSCFSGNSKTCKKTNTKNSKEGNLDSFSVEEEVEKLRIKQDEFKTRS